MDKVRIIIQARLSSTRLPAKSLLPVAGYPLVVLSALRAGNTGLPVVLATSLESSDDPLEAMAKAHGIAVFRGSLKNVYHRFLEATRDLSDDDWIVRLTGDNLFPDGPFIEKLLKAAQSSGVAYMGTSSPRDGLPYGLSAEVFRAAALRSVSGAMNAFDEEHVTPAIKRQFGCAIFRPLADQDFSALRCTVDSFPDYLRILKIFSEEQNSVKVSWMDLCEKLKNLPESPKYRLPYIEKNGNCVGRLTLGTAQLGLPNYGRTNRGGMPDTSSAVKLIQGALEYGVTHIDTANAYGLAEQRVGSAVLASGRDATLITKLSPLSDLSDSASPVDIRHYVDASVFRSCHALNRKSLDVLMLHRWEHYHLCNGQLWRHLQELGEKGLIREFGASVYTPAEAIEALAVPDIKHLQIPCNLLDFRWLSSGFVEARKARSDVFVYVRSAFLQGLLLLDAKDWGFPRNEDFDMVTTWLDKMASKFDRSGRADLSIAYLLGSGLVDSIVIGMEEMSQLTSNIEVFRRKPLTGEQIAELNASRPEFPEWVLNPTLWPSKQ